MKTLKAFTLFELLAVLFILAGIATPIVIVGCLYSHRLDIAKGVGEFTGTAISNYQSTVGKTK